MKTTTSAAFAANKCLSSANSDVANFIESLRIQSENLIIHKTELHTVPPLKSAQRMQDYGLGIFKSVPTKSALKKAIKKGQIEINGVPARTGSFLSGGEQIRYTAPDSLTPKTAFRMKLKVLFEDDHLAIIHKPAGILVSGNRFKTIANALTFNIHRSTHPDATAPQPVHRLDYPTTGSLLIGKTAGCIRALNRLFSEKQIAKTYYAITIGEMDEKGEIIDPIDGKPARSHYRKLFTVASERFGQLNLLKLNPRTGRRHQLRKHLAMIGNPILGDKAYGVEHLILNGKGLYLHSCGLEFTHPVTHETISVNDPLPVKFRKIFPELG